MSAPNDSFSRAVASAVQWISVNDRRNLYHNFCEFCADLFGAEVCSIFVRDMPPDDNRVVLMAGRLPDGRRMDQIVSDSGSVAHSYGIGEVAGGAYDGLTGRIATLGEVIRFSALEQEVRKDHKGKWDESIWGTLSFQCMVGVPIMDGKKVIGVLKAERSTERPQFSEDTERELTIVAQHLGPRLAEIRQEGATLTPSEDVEYRLIRSHKERFERKSVGEVVVEHAMTSVCQSDIFYFKHDKSEDKLNQRLPMVLGHECVARVIHTSPGARYSIPGESSGWDQGDVIQTGDRVFVIPLMPCGTCRVCADSHYGENYCPSSKFMASNAAGSLRSRFSYDANLLIKLPVGVEDHVGVFAEPMANVVHMLQDSYLSDRHNRSMNTLLGFEQSNPDSFKLPSWRTQDFTYFHVLGEQFTTLFNTVLAQEPNPLTAFKCFTEHQRDVGLRYFDQKDFMAKGLALSGGPELDGRGRVERPTILVLGTSVSSYLLVLTLTHVFKVDPESITVVGRTNRKLNQMSRELHVYTHHTPEIQESDVRDLRGESFDIVFECVGGEATNPHLQAALELAKTNGVVGMFGITGKPIAIDFNKVIDKQLFVKGSYRASLNTYFDTVRYIGGSKHIQRQLDGLIVSKSENERFFDVGDFAWAGGLSAPGVPALQPWTGAV